VPNEGAMCWVLGAGIWVPDDQRRLHLAIPFVFVRHNSKSNVQVWVYFRQGNFRAAATAVAASTFYCKLIMHTKQVLSIVSSGLAEDAPLRW